MSQDATMAPRPGGRHQQKARTRRDLLEAAREVMARGEPFSVNTVADAAGISRATAYRYFPDADALLLEAALSAQVPTPEDLVGEAEDVRERVHRVRHYLFEAVRDAETFYRRYLARTLEASVAPRSSGPGRGGRRLPMYEHALAPLRDALSPAAHRDLVLALSAASGVESFIALRDACGVDLDTAQRISAAIVDAILDRALAAPPPGRAGRARPPD